MAIYHVGTSNDGSLAIMLEIHEGKRRAFSAEAHATAGEGVLQAMGSLSILAGTVRGLSGSDRVAQVKSGGKTS